MDQATVTEPIGFLNPYIALDSAIIAVGFAAFSITTMFMIIRAASLWDIGKFEGDDCCLIVAYVFNVAGLALMLVQDTQGVSHSDIISALQVAPLIAQEGLAMELLYCIIVFFAKAAVLLQLARVFAPSRKGAVFSLCYALILFNLIFYLGSGTAILLQCIPLQKLWNPLEDGSCKQQNVTLLFSGAVNVVSDAIIFLLPLWMLWRLDAKSKYRVDVIGVFSTAGLAMTASIGRAVYSCFLLSSNDPIHVLGEIELWTMSETTLLVICPSFLFVPRFIRIILGQSQFKTQPRQRMMESSNSDATCTGKRELHV